ncbi:SpoIID/LytB domain-containing protein [Alkalibacter rhizosphaerae]|uniref:SpoIID/LytB domain-containing protein n=1 Tax=Alkalibacter rhizosphaerae TaxID=2815577 RepID=A0A975AHX6_9FIRM|nr:SpoIID/LytB domain-containing protein [Alkalibacter rhizosphaerae]QSX07945.1 SpoIID/LytB domain-containing protein [Alkalibacter rhizosphaerae]
MVSRKKRWIVYLVVALLIGWIMPATSAATDYRTIRARITMGSSNLKSVTIALNGDYALMQDPSLTLPVGAYTIKVEADATNLRLVGNGIDVVVGPEIRFIRMKYSGTAVSTLRLNGTYHGDKNYLGDMRFHTSSGSILVTNHVPLEEYLYGVVAYEMSNAFPVEALKAQAVSARGYAIMSMTDRRDYDIGDTASTQVYKGYDPNVTRVIQAVNETKGQVVAYNDKIVSTYYAASNGGQMDLVSNVWGSNDASYPYLVMKDDPYDLRNPSSLTQRVFVPSQVTGTKYDVISSEKVVRVINVSTYLNIRSGPTTSYDVIGQATLNQLFAYVGTDASGWHKINFYKDGKLTVGYVSDDYSVVETNQQNGYLYGNPVLQDLQKQVFEQIGASNSIANANQIKINQVDRFVNGQRRWPEPSRSYVTAVADVKIQYKKADGSLSNEMAVTNVTIALMMPNGSGGYYLGHDYLNSNLRLRFVETAQDNDGITGYNIVNLRYGHGIGMSQRGAQQMANEGLKYTDILSFYFEGTTLKTYETTVPELPNRGDSPPDPPTNPEEPPTTPEDPPTTPNPTPTVTTTTYTLGANSISGISEKTPVETFVSKFTVKDGSLALVGSDNKAKTTGNVATGDVLYVKDGAEKIVKSYTIVIYGDVNGDGEIDIFDSTTVRRHIMSITQLSGVYYNAANLVDDNNIDIFDSTVIKRHILGITLIKQ